MKKVLIANRGEIAVRVIRACHDLGLQAVAVYSTADAEALHVLHADEAICIGEGPSKRSYLKVPNILAACEITGADAIHPGYGFLSESADFASICESCGLTFIGSSSKTIALLGDKVKAKALAQRVQCPVIPGSEGAVKSVEEGIREADRIGYPLLIKAAAGGGGKGIRIVRHREEFDQQFQTAASEAKVAFGNSDLYLEKQLKNPRHVEIQVVGDMYGHYVQLGERDCTVQRQCQKLIEETPSPILSASMRDEMGKMAIDVVKAVGYYTVGTVEFLVDQDRQFYFMEVNARVQVEHTITEELTGVDLVREQIKLAMKEKLSLGQQEVRFGGHIFQFRINAENPAKQFMPSPGSLEYYIPPGGPHVRVDSACYSGYRIPPYYDSLIAKLVVKGRDRSEAIVVALRALQEFHIGGVYSTIPFHQFVLTHMPFLSSQHHLGYVDELMAQGQVFEPVERENVE